MDRDAQFHYINNQALVFLAAGDPVYLVPKVMLLPSQLPFHPIRTLKGLLPEDRGTSRTNAQALNSPKQN